MSNSDSSHEMFGRKFPNPFESYATSVLPTDWRGVIDWCDKVLMHCPELSGGLFNACAYFITSLSVKDTSAQETKTTKDTLEKKLRVYTHMLQFGINLASYGNGMTIVFPGYIRQVVCANKECRSTFSVDRIPFGGYTLQAAAGKLKIQCRCPECGKQGNAMDLVEVASKEVEKVSIYHINLKDMDLRADPITGRATYLWRPPPSIKQSIDAGDPLILQHTPQAVILAAINGTSGKVKLNPEALYHGKAVGHNLSRVPAGWGTPPLLPLLRTAYGTELMKVYDETLAADYVVPTRILSPEMGAGGTNPFELGDMGQFASFITDVKKRDRRNPGGWYFSPFPVKYQALGGEALGTGTHQRIEASTSAMLNSLGIPKELWSGSLSFNAAPYAIRLFQSRWDWLFQEYNAWLRWLVDRVGSIVGWDRDIDVSIMASTLADDMERRGALLSLMNAKKVSDETALGSIGVDAAEERERRASEEQAERELQAQLAQDAQAAEMFSQTMQAAKAGPQAGGGGGPPPPGGGPPPPGGGAGGPAAGSSMAELWAEAQAQAQSLMQQDPASRRKVLGDMKSGNPQLHALVTQLMQDTRQDAASQGKQQVLAQNGMSPT